MPYVQVDDYEIADYAEPKWDEYERVHGWRNYVNEELRRIWPTFSDEQKLAVARNARDIASQEDWD